MVRTVSRYAMLFVCLLCAPPLLAADFRPLYVQGNQAYSQKNYAEALKLYRASEEANPKAGLPVWGEANCLYREGKKSEALDTYRRALALMPGDARLQTRVRTVEQELNTPTKAAEPQAGAPASAAQDQAIDTFQVGVGFPDIRVRYKAWGPLDVEAKVAADSESVAYAARLYYNPYTVGPVKLLVGAEGGGLSFSGLDSLSGTGGYWEPFVGLQYVFIPRWSLQADVGPAWISETSHGVSVTDQQWIANFALYYAIF